MEIQNIMEALDLEVLFNEMDKLVNDFESSSSDEDTLDELPMRPTFCSFDSNKPGKSRDWIKEIIANDQTDSDDSDFEDIQFYLRFHQTCNKYADETKIDPDLFKYMHYSTDIVTGESKYKNNQSEQRRPKAKSRKGPSAAIKEEPSMDDELLEGDRMDGKRSFYKSGISDKRKLGSSKKANVDTIRKRLWKSIAKKDIPKAYRQKSQNRAIKGMLLKKLIKEACKRLRVKAIESRQKCRSEAIVSRARRMTREAQVFWKKYSKVEKSQRKRAEKQALVQRKLDEEIREAQRQRRKLNYLITQTELYAHFMCGKLKKTLADGATKDESDILNQLIDEPQFGGNDEYTKESALEKAQAAYEVHQQSTNEFTADKDLTDFTNFQQPAKLVGKLTGYQLTGVNWLAGLYAHGLNGILADDMGLGKTIQTIAFLAHLSERIGIWGPFLVVAPASTLNNWHQEFARFLPSFKVLPYWGNVNERKILRLFWNPKESSSGTTSAPFHVLVTSYQLVISDVRYFQRIKWQYMVLDEAHALKSTSSIRWKTLLDFNCRNRLLLTGTPIQNTMAELWALLHFIMPTLFDNHGEFNEWFSKDIEYHAENKSNIDEKHLSRLHMILKPFMLRRLKSEVEHELTDKIEVRVMCQLAPRQRRLYDSLQKNITLQELLKKTTSVVPSNASGNVLMNLVMQFRKMCNHPDLFDSHDVHSSFLLSTATYRLPALLYHEIFTGLLSPTRRKLLYSDFSVHSPGHVHRSLTSIDCDQQSCFSFLRLMDLSVSEYAMHFSKSATTRFEHCQETRRRTKARLRAQLWGLHAPKKSLDSFPRFASNRLFSNKNLSSCAANPKPPRKGSFSLLLPTFVERFQAASSRSVFTSFVFCRRRRDDRFFFAHADYDVTSLSHTERSSGAPVTGKRRATGAQELVINLKNQSIDDMFQQRVVADQMTCQPVPAPKLIKDVAKAKVYSFVPEIYCNERGAAHKLQQVNSLMRGNCFENFNPVSIPDRERLVSDSGKLLALDMLLRRLKDGGHRVLIYSQMTKMIDLLEEYMVLRRHTYVRLDGSSRISSRRDTVAGFQARNDIFVFLLSTRAGGLGINLTAADTVIFFDSDWNPTVDQQAMDRAHRLGQTKQVTVYRLVCQGTVDERVLQRAEEKSAIQNMVISGGSFKADSLKPKEVVSLLLDDQQMAREFNEMGETPGRKFVIGGRRGKKRGRKSNREKEMERAKRLRELEGGSTSPAPDPSAFLGPAASTVMRISGSGQPSREASPTSSSFADSNTPSELSCDGDSRGAEEEPLIVVDELPPFDSPPVPDVRRGRRGRGRPRIRPLVPRKPHFLTRTTSSRSRGPRSRGGRRAGRKAFSGRAAAMAGARAGMAAASAAAFAAYGYNLPSSSGGS